MRGLVSLAPSPNVYPCRMVLGDKMVVTGICGMVFARSSRLLVVLMCLRLWGTAKFYSIYRESLFVRSCSGVAFGGTESGIYKLGLPGVSRIALKTVFQAARPVVLCPRADWSRF